MKTVTNIVKDPLAGIRSTGHNASQERHDTEEDTARNPSVANLKKALYRSQTIINHLIPLLKQGGASVSPVIEAEMMNHGAYVIALQSHDTEAAINAQEPDESDLTANRIDLTHG